MADRQVTIRISAVDQFSTTFKTYNDQVGRAASETEKAGRSTSNFSNTVRGLFTVAMIQQVGNYVGEMINLGTEANATEQRFRNFTATMAPYPELMQRLQHATMGVADEMTLQSGAMLLAQTTGIKTADELERMMGIIARSKKPSEDMTTAMNNFGLMLANNSILRLDSFGISASAVRARIIELQASGEAIDRSQAFRMAVMEEAEKNLTRLGSAATVAGTALGRLQTQIADTFQDVSQQVASGAEGMALGIEFLTGNNAAQQNAAAAFEEQVAFAINQLKQKPELAGVDESWLTEFVRRSVRTAWDNPEVVDEMKQGRSDLIMTLTQGALTNIPTQLFTTGNDFLDIGGLFGSAVDASRMVDTLNAQAEAAQKAADAEAERVDLHRRAAEYAEAEWNFMQKGMEANIRANEAAAEMATTRQQMIDAMSGLEGNAAGIFGGGEYASTEQADLTREMADYAQSMLDSMKEMDEVTPELFTDDQLKNAEGTASKVGEIADEAERAAEAFQNISLSEMFGQTSGGTQGEILDQVLEQVEAMGALPGQLQAIQDQFALSTGKETVSSQYFDDEIAPMLADIALSSGPTLAAQLAESLDATLKDAILAGVDVNDENFLGALGEQFTTEGFDPETFVEGFTDAAVQTDAMKIGLDGSVTAVETIQDILSTLASKVTNVKVNFEYVNQFFLEQLIGQTLQRIVGNNGGVVPGGGQNASSAGIPR